MASTPGQYLLAVDRREVIETRITRINEKAAAEGTDPLIHAIFSKSEGRFEAGTENVRQALREQPTKDANAPHVVVICTHEGLLSSDLSTYQGWMLIIDETPNIWTFDEIRAEHTWPVYKKFFGLEPDEGGLSCVTIRNSAPTVTALSKDKTLSQTFVDTYRRWQATRPLVKLASWDELEDGQARSWCSVWKSERLHAFKRVMILANSFEDSLTYKLLKQAGVHLVPFAIPDDRQWQPRTVFLRYFASTHRAGTGFWTNSGDPGGAVALQKTFDWIMQNTDPENHFWSANLDALRRVNLPGQKLQPKVAGSDAYKHLTCASFIYTAKPSRAEVEAFARYGITYDEIVRARQNEDLVQFLWRSALRVPDDTRDVEFRVYDLAQATFLKEFIEATGRPFKIILEHVIEAGVDDYKPKPVGRPKVAKTEAEKQAQAAKTRIANALSHKKRRDAQSQRDREDGIVRKRGRPPKYNGGGDASPDGSC
ncbi:hypothetical protein J4G37_25785 [Microvirga sp. 3-52]|nr:hypothetical protein [Microvirga sp. 3-52]